MARKLSFGLLGFLSIISTYRYLAAAAPCGFGKSIAVPGSGRVCICPLDRVGSSCESPRRFTCLWKRQLPVCNASRDLGAGRWNHDLGGTSLAPCIFSKKENLGISAILTCAFSDPVAPIPSNVQRSLYDRTMQSFTYWTFRDQSFALSAPVTMKPLLRPINWRNMYNISTQSEASGLVQTLSIRQVAGLEPVSWSLDVAGLSSDYWAGGRCYIEGGFVGVGDVPGLVDQPLLADALSWSSRSTRMFTLVLDDPLYTLSAPSLQSNLVLIVAVTVVSVVVVGGLIFGMIWLCRTRDSDAKED